MSDISGKTGPYRHAITGKQAKIFEGGRKFTVIRSTAIDANGLIGTEYNGIVILDDDNLAVVLDRHAIGRDESYQETEFNRILAMDWQNFSEFCRSHARYRHMSKDIDSASATPMKPDLLNQAISQKDPEILEALSTDEDLGRKILPQNLIDADLNLECPYRFPFHRRGAIIASLANHHASYPMNSWNGGFVLAWDAVPGGKIDYSGYGSARKEAEQAKVKFEKLQEKSAFDDAWASYSDNHDVMQMASEDIFFWYLEGEWVPYPGGNPEGYGFTMNNENLILESWPGPKPDGWKSNRMVFNDRHDFTVWLENLEDDDLVRFYTMVCCVDHEMSDLNEKFSLAISDIRERMEEDLKEWPEYLENTADMTANNDFG